MLNPQQFDLEAEGVIGALGGRPLLPEPTDKMALMEHMVKHHQRSVDTQQLRGIFSHYDWSIDHHADHQSGLPYPGPNPSGKRANHDHV